MCSMPQISRETIFPSTCSTVTFLSSQGGKTHTGVDFAGPLYVRDTVTFAARKVWICLYTCCVTRAVRLDITPNITTEAFIRCFKCFTSRRGFPVRMVPDNATTFKADSYYGNIGNQWLSEKHWCKMVIQFGEGTMVGRSVQENDSDSKEMSKEDHWKCMADNS